STSPPPLPSPFPYTTLFRSKTLTPRKIAEYRAALKPLIWVWKSPLQREWYPYLYALDADLRLLERGKDAPDEAWIRKKYSTVVRSEEHTSELQSRENLVCRL